MTGAPLSGSNLPSEFTVGGQLIKVLLQDRCSGNRLGECELAKGELRVADFYDKETQQSDSSKLNTFYHELVHCILDTMGEYDLSKDEKFVCSFAGFLTSSIITMKYK